MTFHCIAQLDHEHYSGQWGSSFGDNLRRREWTFNSARAPRHDRVRFAVAAWRVATPPVAEPSFVRFHERVLRVTVKPVEWHLLASVDLAAVLPTRLCCAVPRPASTWLRSGTSGFRCPPIDSDLMAVLPTLTVRVPVPSECLPEPLFDRCGSPERARAIEAVEAVCDAVNANVGPILDELVQSAAPQ